MTTRPATPLRILLATDDSPAPRTTQRWIARLRWASAPVVDVVCPRRRGRDLFAEKVVRHAPVSVLIVAAT